MEMRQLLPHLHYFWAVAKNKSFTKTAEELHVTPSAISYQVRSLEEKLNVLLLKRDNGQRTELTEIGEKVAAECNKIFAHIDGSLGSLIKQEREGELKITSPVAYGTFLLIPALDYINTKMAGADFGMQITDIPLDIFENSIDIAIRNLPPSENTNGEQLMLVQHVAIASEEYLENSQPLNSVKDLSNHNIVSTKPDSLDWARVQAVYPEFVMPPTKNVTYINNNLSIVEAVRVGMGVAIIPNYVARGVNIESKKIQLVLTDYFNESVHELMDTLFVCYPQLTIKDSKIKDFIMYLKEHLRNNGEIVF